MTMSSVVAQWEEYRVRLHALRLLCNLGWRFLSGSACLAWRGSHREVLLKPRLVEILRSRSFKYNGRSFPLPPDAIERAVSEISAIDPVEGDAQLNEPGYAKFLFGVPLAARMSDGSCHSFSVAAIDWANPDANIWEVTEAPEVQSAQSARSRRPDIVCYVNGIPIAVIEAQRAGSGTAIGRPVDEGIERHLRNQRRDEIPRLFTYAKVLLSISRDDGRFGTTNAAAGSWARWKEEQFSEEHVAAAVNLPLDPAVKAALFEGKPVGMSEHFASLWSRPMPPSDADRLLVSLLTPKRLLDLCAAVCCTD
jgi:type I restriction enzyme R subunit